MAEPISRSVALTSAKSGSRTRLREFQAGLAERLRQAATAPTAQSRLAVRVACEGGEQNYLIDLPEAGEIISIPEVSSVPLTKPWYIGLANVRGNLVSVVDLARFDGRGATLLDKDSRVLAFSLALRFNAGILVTRMLGLRNTEQLTQVERTDRATRPMWVGNAFRDTDGVLWDELRLAALAADERFLQIGIW
ncbi:MAG: chemotaxis protein CheW [Burkholderiaceae bacterium]|jgi:twitching motility protein PilI